MAIHVRRIAIATGSAGVGYALTAAQATGVDMMETAQMVAVSKTSVVPGTMETPVNQIRPAMVSVAGVPEENLALPVATTAIARMADV